MAGGDACPHDAGPDDGWGGHARTFDRGRSAVVADAGVAAVSLADGEHAEQVAGDRRRRELREGGRLDPGRLLGGSGRSGEDHLQNGRRGGIVAAGAAEHHRGTGGLEKLSLHGIKVDRPGHSQAAGGEGAVVSANREQQAGGVERLISRHAGVDEPEPLGR